MNVQMFSVFRWSLGAALCFVLMLPSAGWAQHQLILGPQSHQTLEAGSHVGLQTFYRQRGRTLCTEKHETTVIFNAGFRPVQSVPLSVSIALPVSYIWDASQNFNDTMPDHIPSRSRTGVEDAIIALNYRLDFDKLQQQWRATGNYLLMTVGLEVPTGDLDHPAYDGPLDYVFGTQLGLEWRMLSGTVYGFYRLTTDTDDGAISDNVLAGLRFGYTPWEDLGAQRYVSVQLGVGYEQNLDDDFIAGYDTPEAGWSVLIHPMVVVGLNANLRLTVMGSIPVAKEFEHDNMEDRFRVNLGLLYVFGG